MNFYSSHFPGIVVNVVNFFVPTGLQDEEDIKIYQIQIFTILLGLVTGAFFSVYCYMVGLTFMAIGCGICTILGPIGLIFIKSKMDLVGSSWFMFFAMFMILMANLGGGLGATPPIIWLTVFPVLPTVMRGLKYGVFWSAILYVCYLSLELYRFFYGYTFNQFTPLTEFSTNLVNIILGMSINILFIAYALETKEALKEELKEANLERKKLLSMVFHDMANNLTAAYHRLQPERIGIGSDFPKAEEYNSGFKNLEQMQNLLNHVRELEKLKNIDELPSKKVDLNLLIADSLNTFRERIQDKEISIKLDLREKYIFTNKHSLQFNILNNLISNAIKFTPRGETISISSDKINESFELSVSNPGDPIIEEVRKDLFKINKQATSLGTEGERGSGFGLAIAHDVAKKLVGELTYDHGKKGITFVFRRKL